MRVWRSLMLAGLAMLVLSGASCMPLHSNRLVGQPLSRPERIQELQGLWTDGEIFYFANVEDQEQGILRIGAIKPPETELRTFDLVVRETKGAFVLNEQDSVLRGEYAFGVVARYAPDQLIAYFPICQSAAIAELIRDGQLQGRVLEEAARGSSGFGGTTDVSVVLDGLTDEQLDSLLKPRSTACEQLAWPLSRLRRFP